MDNLLSKKLNIKIDNAICISLKTEEKRRQETIEECNKIGLPVKFLLVEPHPNGGVEGCKDSHKKVIQYAKENNLEYILVLEDDVLFDTHMLKYMKPIHIPKHFDMFYLGYHINRGFRIGDQLLQILSGLTTHAYIMRNTVYDLFLDFIDKEWNIPEFKDLNQFEKPFFTQQKPIKAVDMFYAKYIHHARGETYGVYPMIAYQRPEFSRIENTHVDYRQLFVTKANFFAKQIKSQLRCQYIQKDQDKVIIFLENCSLAHDYDYIHVQPEIRLNPFTKPIQNTDWDVLYITNDEYLIRKQAIYHKKDTWRIKYLYPNCSLTPDKQYKWLPEKPIICFYGKENELIDQLMSHYHIFYCSEEYQQLKQISNDKVLVPKHFYNSIPNHQVLLKNDITFFIDHAVIKPNIILWMTKDTFDYQWKCDWWQEKGEYTIPFEGKALFTNMSRYISTILFDTQDICDRFCKKYDVIFNSKNMMVLSNGKHNFDIQENLEPTPWKIVAKTNGENFMNYINTFKMLKKQFSKFTLDLYGCSKGNKKKLRNMNIQGIKVNKGDIEWKKGDVLLLLEDDETLYWQAKMSACFVVSDKHYSYMDQNGGDIIIGEHLPTFNREELKRNSLDYGLKQKGSNRLIDFFTR